LAILKKIHILEYPIKKLNYKDLPYTEKRPVSLDIEPPIDKKGIPIFIYNGKKHYHPVRIALKMLSLINSYIITNNNEYLKKTEKLGSTLLDKHHFLYDSILFPYTFDFPLHNFENEKMKAPWYSGMAQGLSLSAFIRLHKLTSNKEYLKISDKIFNSFYLYKDKYEPWIVFVDKNGYLWIEEYPMEQLTHVLNGFIFSIYGLYDYYLCKENIKCKELIQASLITIKKYLPLFRKKDEPSLYCLKHKIQSIKYHDIHISQLNMLYKFTGDNFFSEWRQKFINDYNSELFINKIKYKFRRMYKEKILTRANMFSKW
jgi:hypothetical protein